MSSRNQTKLSWAWFNSKQNNVFLPSMNSLPVLCSSFQLTMVGIGGNLHGGFTSRLPVQRSKRVLGYSSDNLPTPVSKEKSRTRSQASRFEGIFIFLKGVGLTREETIWRAIICGDSIRSKSCQKNSTRNQDAITCRKLWTFWLLWACRKNCLNSDSRRNWTKHRLQGFVRMKVLGLLPSDLWRRRLIP